MASRSCREQLVEGLAIAQRRSARCPCRPAGDHLHAAVARRPPRSPTAGEDPAVEQSVARAANEASDRWLSRATMSAAALQQSADVRLAERLRAAGEGAVEEGRAGRVPRLAVRTLRRGGVSRWPYSSRREVRRRRRSGRWNRFRRRTAPPAARKAPRGNTPSPRLASVIGQRPATAPLAASALASRSGGWRGPGTSGVDGGMVQQPFHRPLADQARQSSTSLDLLGGVDVDRPVAGQAATIARKLVRRHGAQAVRRDAENGVGQRPHERARQASTSRANAVEVVDEAPLARRSAARRRKSPWA